MQLGKKLEFQIRKKNLMTWVSLVMEINYHI